MKESEANLLQCCGPEGCGMVNNGVRYCVATACVAWEPWDRFESKYIEKDEDAPQGWERDPNSGPVKFRITRIVKTHEGDCGLKSSCNGCSYPG